MKRKIHLGSIFWTALRLVLVSLTIIFPATMDYWIAPAALLSNAGTQQQLDQNEMPRIDKRAISP